MIRRLLVGLVLVATAASLAGSAEAHGGRELHAARRATVRYHNVENAERDGYEQFLDCFDDPHEGGMGQHYVDIAALDDEVSANRPEALVYEMRGHRLHLVAVEYIAPVDLAPTAPSLFGRTFHLNEAGDAWILHAWIWRYNPSGLFADYNPLVNACPDQGS